MASVDTVEPRISLTTSGVSRPGYVRSHLPPVLEHTRSRMDFDDTPAERALRTEARTWLDANATRVGPEALEELRTFRTHTEEEDAALVEEARAWQRRKAAAGWAAPTWPAELGGRGLGPLLARVFGEEESDYDVAGRMFSVGTEMVGPTIIEWGTDEQRAR